MNGILNGTSNKQGTIRKNCLNYFMTKLNQVMAGANQTRLELEKMGEKKVHETTHLDPMYRVYFRKLFSTQKSIKIKSKRVRNMMVGSEIIASDIDIEIHYLNNQVHLVIEVKHFILY